MEEKKIWETYAELMDIVSKRIEAIKLVIDEKIYMSPFPSINIEFLALQLRKILETIALSSLVANVNKYKEAHENFAKHWHGKRIMEKIEKFNKDFYPRPHKTINRTSKKPHWISRSKNEYLTEEDWEKAYNFTSELLHAKNPFDLEKEEKSNEEQIIFFITKIVFLLEEHTLILDGEVEIVCLMKASSNGYPPYKAWVQRLER